jgi:phage/plasmid primase-like uncharacterized protein
MMTFDEAVAALPAGRLEGDRYRAPCPAHGGRDRNLSVWPDENGDACFKCWSHGCSTRAIVAALAITSTRKRYASASNKPNLTNEPARILAALRIWEEAQDPRGTIVQDYLFGRGFTWELPLSIRFHPRLWHSPRLHFPAMVAAFENRDGKIAGIHRTYLRPDGTGKAEIEHNKKALAPMRGCAVHLTAADPILVVCEGIETGLSILQETGLHVWAALGTSNLGSVELPSFVRKVLIAADNDDPGTMAAQKAADSYQARGYQVQIVSPLTEKEDWNDVLRR